MVVRRTDLGCTGDGAGTAEGRGGFIGEGLVDLEFGRSGGSSVHNSCATAEELNKLEGKGCGIPNSSGLEKLSWISEASESPCRSSVCGCGRWVCSWSSATSVTLAP